MNKKDLSLPFDGAKAEVMAELFGTPLYIYDEAGIRNQAEKLNQAFSWARNLSEASSPGSKSPDSGHNSPQARQRNQDYASSPETSSDTKSSNFSLEEKPRTGSGYKNFFAVKALPTPAILKILHEEGMGFDCSSRSELLIMQKMGISGEDIFFTSNNTPKEDFELAIEIGATVNIDDLTQVPVFIEALAGKEYQEVAARYNPGDLKAGNTIIGKPKEAKYGMRLDQLVEAFKLLKAQNIKQFGLHTMVASNELNAEYFAETAEILLAAVKEVEEKASITFSFVNLGGGFGVNYQLHQVPLDISAAANGIKHAFEKAGRQDLEVFTENGRYVTGPHGYLLTKVRYAMEKYKKYIGVDASMHNLMRPGMYRAYHHITVLGKEDYIADQTYDIVGSLCENNDKFAIDRKLPKIQVGELLVIHDAGAHGHAMGFNYNGLLRSAEVLLKTDGSVELIRKAETVDQYLQNIIWPLML